MPNADKYIDGDGTENGFLKVFVLFLLLVGRWL